MQVCITIEVKDLQERTVGHRLSMRVVLINVFVKCKAPIGSSEQDTIHLSSNPSCLFSAGKPFYRTGHSVLGSTLQLISVYLNHLHFILLAPPPFFPYTYQFAKSKGCLSLEKVSLRCHKVTETPSSSFKEVCPLYKQQGQCI